MHAIVEHHEEHLLIIRQQEGKKRRPGLQVSVRSAVSTPDRFDVFCCHPRLDRAVLLRGFLNGNSLPVLSFVVKANGVSVGCVRLRQQPHDDGFFRVRLGLLVHLGIVACTVNAGDVVSRNLTSMDILRICDSPKVALDVRAV